MDRVNHLWRQGEQLGAGLQRPLVLAECVPGGTTTAQAVLTALGFEVGDLISGSARQPPQAPEIRFGCPGVTQRAGLTEGCSAEAGVGGGWGSVSGGGDGTAGGRCSIAATRALGGRQSNVGRGGVGLCMLCPKQAGACIAASGACGHNGLAC